MGRGRGPARRVPGGGGVGGGPVTPARAQRRRAPVRQHDSACREETEEGACGPVRGKRKENGPGPME
jgi:hypothetical protein